MSPALAAGLSRTGMGGLRLFTVTPSLSARIGPFVGPIQAFSAIFARTGPRFGPIQALLFNGLPQEDEVGQDIDDDEIDEECSHSPWRHYQPSNSKKKKSVQPVFSA